MKIPEKIRVVLNYYGECFAKRDRCLHCNDCIAFALIYSETLALRLPPKGVPYVVKPGHAWNFVKFLCSTISREYLPCDRALPYEQIKSFAWSLLRLPLKVRAEIRSHMICHSEFTSSKYSDGVLVFRMAPEKFEAYRRAQK